MRKITLLRNLLFSAAALSLAACNNASVDPEITLEVSPAKILLESGNGAANTFQITCNDAWTLTESADWFESSDESGVNDMVVTVTATSENPSTELRSASITVRAGEIVKTITVEQAGTVKETEIYDLEAEAGSEGVVFALSGTQQGVSYTLLYEGEPVGTALEGTGAAAEFEGNFTDEGVYTARSIASVYPQTDMNGSFTVTVTTHIPTFIYYATEYSEKPNEGIYKYDLFTGTETKLGEVTTNIQCMEYIDGTMYGIIYDKYSYVNDLVTVDMSTGALTTIQGGIPTDGIGLAYNEVDGKTYVSTWDKKFGSIDLATGDFTPIGSLPYIISIAIDNEGVCYAQSLKDLGDQLAHFGTVDIADGSYTEIATYDDYVSFIQNMSIDRATDDLYWMQRIQIDFSTSEQTLLKMDKATGEYIEINSFDKYIQSIAIVNEGDVPVDVYEVVPTVE